MENPTQKTIEQFLFEHPSLKNGGVLQRIYFKASSISAKNLRKVMDSAINAEILDLLENEEWLDYAQNNLSSEKIATLILAAADIDPDTTRTMAQNARKNHCRRKFLTVDHLFALLNFEQLHEITECNLRELIHFSAVGKINPAELELHLENNLRYLSSDDSKIYAKAKHLNLVFDESAIEFFNHKISFAHLESVRNLHSEWQAEFWRWIELKYSTDIKKPELIFFELFEDRDLRDLSFSDFVKMRERLTELGSDGLQDLEMAKSLMDFDYDYRFELFKIEQEMENFSPHSFTSRESTDVHHIFFPESAYQNNPVLRRFRNKEENTIRILINSHEKLNAKFKKLRDYHGYEIPIVSEELITIIEANRKSYASGYMNFLELKRILAETCFDYIESFSRKELEKIEVFHNAAALFRFLRICSRFITPKTTKLYTKMRK